MFWNYTRPSWCAVFWSWGFSLFISSWKYSSIISLIVFVLLFSLFLICDYLSYLILDASDWFFNLNLIVLSIVHLFGLSGGLGGKESASQCRRCWLSAWSGAIPRAVGPCVPRQLSLWTAALAPACDQCCGLGARSPCSTQEETLLREAGALQLGNSPVLCNYRGSPCSSKDPAQWEKQKFLKNDSIKK